MSGSQGGTLGGTKCQPDLRPAGALGHIPPTGSAAEF